MLVDKMDTSRCHETEQLRNLRDNTLSSIKLFIAADIPQSIVPSLEALQQALTHTTAVYPLLRYTPQKTFHITLAYFGSQDVQKIEQIIKLCHLVQHNFAQQIFTANFHGSILKFYGNSIEHEKARIRYFKGGAALALTLHSNLYEIAQLLTQECKDLLPNHSPKPFTPHLTIGRMRIVERKNIEKHERAEVLSTIEKLIATTSVQIPNFIVPSFTLFESQGNGNYIPLITCPLRIQ